MVSTDFSEAITETLDILKHMDNVYIDKIPKKLMHFLENNRSKTYIFDLDHSKKLNEMNLKEKTKDILATLYIHYWCNSEQKLAYLSLLNQNEKNYQKELREKYDSDNLFRKRNQVKIVGNEVAITEYKESIFKRFIDKIKNIFHIN